jgi:hypothetical protein
MLNSKALWSIPERKQHIKQRLHKKYKRLLAMPRWSRDDLEEVHGRLRDYVEISGTDREIIMERLSW